MSPWARLRAGPVAGLLLAILVSGLGTGCSSQESAARYKLAEKLFAERQYPAAVAEFDRVAFADPKSRVGVQAAYRAAQIESLYLRSYATAFRRYSDIAERRSTEVADLARAAKAEAAALLLDHLERFDAAAQLYRELAEGSPPAPEAPRHAFRSARAWFLAHRFDRALEGYAWVRERFPDSPEAKEALFEQAATHFTRGEQSVGGYGPGQTDFKAAIDGYRRFLQLHPRHPRAVEARFGVASALEEMDQLDAAIAEFEGLQRDYPSPKVIEIKLRRIRERRAQRNR